jgi:YebC/PmpR family DNA-binding regulatory protein
MSDNRNRTVAEVRHLLTKHGGNLGQTNSVAWMFKTKGVILVPKEGVSEDQLMEIALEAGADDLNSEGAEFEITTSFEAFEPVRHALEKANIKPSSAELTKIGENPVMLEGDNASKVVKLVDALDELDDTQHVYANFDVSAETMAKLEKE